MHTRSHLPPLRLFVSLALALLGAAAARLQAATSATPGAVTSLTLTGTNTFLSGSTTNFAASSTLNVNGAFGGTPTGGTLSLANVTLSLPTAITWSPTITGNITSSATIKAKLYSTALGTTQTASASTTGVNMGFDSNSEKGWIQVTRNNSSEPRDLLINPLGGTVVFLYGTFKLSDYADGSLSVASGTVTTSSDARLKNDRGAFTRSLADVIKISPRTYTWKPESGIISDTEYSGFIAQDVQAAIPEAVAESAKGTLGLNTTPIIAALVNSVKELAASNAALAARIAALEAR